jgi:hypothetical protein
MIDEVVCEGTDLAAQIEAMFSNPRIARAHLYNARAGCHLSRAQRV